MIKRRKTKQIEIGGVKIGGDAPITVQSMCNTDTRDVKTTVNQIKRLEEKVKMRGARVIESFTISTKGKSPEKLEQDTEVIIEMKDLRMY